MHFNIAPFQAFSWDMAKMILWRKYQAIFMIRYDFIFDPDRLQYLGSTDYIFRDLRTLLV